MLERPRTTDDAPRVAITNPSVLNLLILDIYCILRQIWGF